MTTRISDSAAERDLPLDPSFDPSFEPDEGDLLLRVTGLVPPADFHPFVVRLARRFGLRGWIRHDPSGALIRAVALEGPLAKFVRALWTDAPPSTRIRSLDPELITAEIPPVGDHFAALAEETTGWHDPEPLEPSPLQHVA